jgi:hypothetical protein
MKYRDDNWASGQLARTLAKILPKALGADYRLLLQGECRHGKRKRKKKGQVSTIDKLDNFCYTFYPSG